MENIEFLKKLTTKRLLNYYRTNREKRRMAVFHPWDFNEDFDKLINEWDEHLEQVKELLNQREHIDKQ